MNNIVDIYNLLPDEIEEAIKKLETALSVVKAKKNTNSKIVDKELNNERSCPICNSNSIVKNGHDKNKIQTYKCKDCKKNLMLAMGRLYLIQD